MLLGRLIWVALGAALLVGSVQTVLLQWQAAPIFLAAEAFEDQKAAPAYAHAAESVAHEDGGRDAAPDWAPGGGVERTAWTWVAHVLHGFSMALLVCVVMCLWVWRRGAPARPLLLGLSVAAAGWLSLHLWPSLGLPAGIAGMDAARLGSRQGWWVLAAASAALACATAAFGRQPWRWLIAIAWLALPYGVGVPALEADPLAGFGTDAQLQLRLLGEQFVAVTRWMSVSLWLSLGLSCGWLFRRWLQTPLLAMRDH